MKYFAKYANLEHKRSSLVILSYMKCGLRGEKNAVKNNIKLHNFWNRATVYPRRQSGMVGEIL